MMYEILQVPAHTMSDSADDDDDEEKEDNDDRNEMNYREVLSTE